MVECQPDGALLQRVVRGVVLQKMQAIPLVRKGTAARQLVRSQRQDAIIRVGRLKAVAVVTLGLQLLAVQLGKLLRLVDIVRAVAHAVEAKAAGTQRLEPVALLGQQAEQAQRDAALTCVLPQQLQRARQVPAAHGPRVRQAPGKIAEEHGRAVHRRYALVPPQVEIHKGKLAAMPGRSLHHGFDPCAVLQADGAKVQHSFTTFIEFWDRIKIFYHRSRKITSSGLSAPLRNAGKSLAAFAARSRRRR